MEMNQNQGQEISFRGYEIPTVIAHQHFEVANDQDVINKVKSMTLEEQRNVTVEAVHFDGWRLSLLKLSTGDIVSLETAIALAQNNMLDGFSTGATMNGGRTLRTKPSADIKIYELPRF